MENINQVKIPEKLTPEQSRAKAVFDELYRKNAGLYTEVAKHMPDHAPEKRLVLEKLCEAGMWCRMWFEMEMGGPIQIVQDVKKVSLDA